MAIAMIYKGVLLACLLGTVLAQNSIEEPASVILEDSATPSAITLDAPTELPTPLSRGLKEKLYQAELLQEQAKNAVYNFTTMLNDKMMDNTQGRQETRNGLEVEGSYWYSDGYYRRIVHYVANENGYKIVSDYSEPLNVNGPVIDPNGRADIYTNIGGRESEYSITRDDVARYGKFDRRPTTISPAEISEAL